MSDIPNFLNDDALLGDDSQDPADHFLLRDGEVEEDTNDDEQDNDGPEDNLTDVEADDMTLTSAGLGTDESYFHFGSED